MKRSIFSYCLSREDLEIEELPVKHSFGKYTIATDCVTPYVSSENGESGCAVFGYAVNVITGEDTGIAEDILIHCKDIDQVIVYEKQLGGKYILFYRKEENYYVIGDATCSIPVFYSMEKSNLCTGNGQYIAEQNRFVPDAELQEIRESGDISQAMPFDVTEYREIKQLIPNHYLWFNQREAKRYINEHKSQRKISVEQAADKTLPMIDILSNYYQKNFKIYCPITAGRDSRVVLAFLWNDGKIPFCYTIRHPEHSENEQDIMIPEKLCSEFLIPYETIQDIHVLPEVTAYIDDLLGKGNYSSRTLRIAETIRENYGDGAIINGDIIGQVGKCSLHRDIPTCFATAGYFRCKLHNYSKNAKKQLSFWLNEIKESREQVNTFDLFSVENRMGRWAGQENLIYNSVGQAYLNIFNSRSIIYVWTAVSRKERKKSMIHISLIEKKKPQLLKLPFESDENIMIKISKSTGSFYLLASYMKYVLEKRAFRREKRNESIDNYSG